MWMGRQAYQGREAVQVIFAISCTPTWSEVLSAKMQMCSVVSKEEEVDSRP